MPRLQRAGLSRKRELLADAAPATRGLERCEVAV
jgi:hypothetical protein